MNFWTLFSLIPGISHLLLGIFVFYKKPIKKLNISFAIYAFSLAIWCISEFFHRSANNAEIAFIWTRIGGLGWCFMSSFWLYFLLVFTRQTNLLRNVLTYIGLYLPSAIILFLFWTTDLIYKQEPTEVFFGYTVLPGKLIWIYTLYYILLYVFGMYFLINIIRNGTTVEKKQAKPVFIGSTFFMLLTTLTNVIFPGRDVPITEFGTTFSIAWAISIFYAVLKHKLFIITTSTEELSDTPIKYSLKNGIGYFIKEEKPDKGYEIFFDQIAHSHSGLCISKLEPNRVREIYKITGSSILWLTFNNQENVISPKDIDGLTSIITDFARGVDNPFCFLDCLDQIKFANGFERPLSMLKDFTKLCDETGATILISISTEMFEEQQIAIIEEKFEEVR